MKEVGPKVFDYSESVVECRLIEEIGLGSNWSKTVFNYSESVLARSKQGRVMLTLQFSK